MRDLFVVKVLHPDDESYLYAAYHCTGSEYRSDGRFTFSVSPLVFTISVMAKVMF